MEKLFTGVYAALRSEEDKPRLIVMRKTIEVLREPTEIVYMQYCRDAERTAAILAGHLEVKGGKLAGYYSDADIYFAGVEGNGYLSRINNRIETCTSANLVLIGGSDFEGELALQLLSQDFEAEKGDRRPLNGGEMRVWDMITKRMSLL